MDTQIYRINCTVNYYSEIAINVFEPCQIHENKQSIQSELFGRCSTQQVSISSEINDKFDAIFQTKQHVTARLTENKCIMHSNIPVMQLLIRCENPVTHIHGLVQLLIRKMYIFAWNFFIHDLFSDMTLVEAHVNSNTIYSR